MPELTSPRAGDYMRTAARMVENAVGDSAANRAMVTENAAGEDHACNMAVTACFLASVLAHCADQAGEDLTGMLASWRQTAEKIDVASGGSPSPN